MNSTPDELGAAAAKRFAEINEAVADELAKSLSPRRPFGDRISSYGVPPQFRPHRLGRQRGQFKLQK